MSNTTLSCDWIKSLENQRENQNDLYVWSSDNFNRSVNESQDDNNVNILWGEMRPFNDRLSRLRTWESLGAPESPKQPLFFTDLPETTLHLARIREACVLSLLPNKVKIVGVRAASVLAQTLTLFSLQVIDSVPLMREVSPEKFLSDVKLLLLGIDSDSFKSDNVVRV